MSKDKSKSSFPMEEFKNIMVTYYRKRILDTYGGSKKELVTRKGFYHGGYISVPHDLEGFHFQ